MTQIKKKDKLVTTLSSASLNESITIAPSQVGQIVISDTGEFGVYQFMLGPPGQAVKIDMFIDLDPSTTTESWSLIKTDTLTGAETLTHTWYSDQMQIMRNQLKIEITNNEVTDITLFYVVSVAPYGQMFNRKY